MANPEVTGDPSFDRYARLVRRLLEVPIAVVSLAEEDRTVVRAAEGAPVRVGSTADESSATGLCGAVIATDRPVAVSDIRSAAEGHREHRAVAELGAVAYAAWPLRDHGGRTFGSLCAIDVEPRRWSADDMATLEDLAGACAAELGQREVGRTAVAEARLAELVAEHGALLLALSETMAATRTLADIADALERVAGAHLGCTHAGMWIDDRATAADAREGREAAAPEAARAEGPGGAGGERGAVRDALEFVVPAQGEWPRALDLTHVAADHDNPIGDAYLSRSTLLLRDEREQSAAYPDGRARLTFGVGRAFVPLWLGTEVHGTLVLVWPDARDFGPQERLTIATLANYTAAAVQRALLLQERVDASVTLQNAMLTDLPEVAGLELAAAYRPAALREQVGGDWYDAIVLPSGDTALVIGDVVGHDIAAAADMGQIRSMLRALAWVGDGAPAATLERLERTSAGLGLNAIATAVYGVLSPDGAFTWSCAGHPPPLLVEPDGTARFLTMERVHMLLGVAPDQPRAESRTDLVPGSTLLLYSDGLFERRGELLDLGMTRLAEAARRHHRLALDDFIAALLADLLPARPGDDAALIAARLRSPETGS